MKKFLITLTIILIIFSIVFCVNKITKSINEIKLATESALNFVKHEYPEHEFYATGITRDNNAYSINLKVNDTKLKTVKLTCKVIPIMNENGHFLTKIIYSTNINLLDDIKTD